MAKIKTLTLQFPVLNMDRNYVAGPDQEDNYVYRVSKVTDSTKYAPGQQLLKRDVQELCDDAAWKITVVAPS